MGGDRRRLFDSWAKRYDESIASSGHPFPFEGYGRVLDAIVSQAAAEPPMSVLDLGIGTGNLAERFAELGCAVWGLDFSPEMLARARKRVRRANLVQADLLGEWPGDLRRRFDRIVSAYVLHEFDLAAKMKLLQRLVSERLAASGRIVIGDIAFPTVGARARAHARWAERWDEEEHYWAADEAIAAGAEGGLRVSYRQISSCGGVLLVQVDGGWPA